MGTSYSDTLSNNAYGATDFFDSLTSCLQAAVGSVKQLAMLKLALGKTPNDEHPAKGNLWAQDMLLVYRGSPLVAVAFRVEGSSSNLELRTRHGVAVSTANAVGAIKQGLRDRLKAADADPEVVVAPPEPTTVMEELAWRITLRLPPLPGLTAPKNQQRIFSGGPFDFDQIEAAFDAIADILEPAIKAAKILPSDAVPA